MLDQSLCLCVSCHLSVWAAAPGSAPVVEAGGGRGGPGAPEVLEVLEVLEDHAANTQRHVERFFNWSGSVWDQTGFHVHVCNKYMCLHLNMYRWLIYLCVCPWLWLAQYILFWLFKLKPTTWTCLSVSLPVCCSQLIGSCWTCQFFT